MFCDLAQHVLSLSVFVGRVPEQVRRLAKHDFKIPDAVNVLGRALCVESKRVVFFKSRPLLQCQTCRAVQFGEASGLRKSLGCKAGHPSAAIRLFSLKGFRFQAWQRLVPSKKSSGPAHGF